MSYQASYNSVTCDPLLEWSEQTTPEMSADGKTVDRYRHVITIRSYFHNTTVANKKTDIDTILSKFRESGQTLLISQDGTDFRTFQASDLLGGGPHPEFTVPGRDPHKVGNVVPYTVTFTGLTKPTGSSLGHSYTDEYRYDQQLGQTYTRRGVETLAVGADAETTFDSRDPGAPSGSGWEFADKGYTVDDDTNQLSYHYTYRQRHEDKAASRAAEDWQISMESEDGVERWTASGTVRYELDTEPTPADVGTILSADPEWPSGVRLVRTSVELDRRNNVLSFTVLAEQPLGGGDTIVYEESIEALTTEQIKDFGVLDSGGDDFSQVVGRPRVTVTQTGVVVGVDGYPSPPAPAYVAENAQRTLRTTKLRPVVAADGGDLRYPLRFTYTFVLLNEVEPGETAFTEEPADHPAAGARPTIEAV